ncbi:hypothetical protein J4416_03020 [Candidatus Pacearchaeota archaeon]|nr:hypothetical protein [Candidatus Pacearchaeota archaeon]
MPSIKNRGISTIVQATLIMALTVVALLVVWGYVKDLSNNFEKQLSPTVDCITQKSIATSACINSEGEILVNLDVKPGEAIKNAVFITKDESFSCSSNSCESCSLSEVEGKKTIYLNPLEQVSNQDLLSVRLNNCNPQQIYLSSCNS